MTEASDDLSNPGEVGTGIMYEGKDRRVGSFAPSE